MNHEPPGERVQPPKPPGPPKRPWHWPTVLFAALPATFLAFPAALAILVGAGLRSSDA